MTRLIGATLLVLLALSGCSIRSISDSGYPDNSHWGNKSSNPFYKGELAELDILGVDTAAKASDQTIQAALQAAGNVSLRKGDSILVMQSGALIPDDTMVRSLERYFTVSTFSGVPQEKASQTNGPEYAAALRLAAARGGCSKIFVYWGMLEAGHKNLATKTVSWFPFVGGILPDETQQMRIRLKVAVIDVATGRWATYSPAGFDDSSTSNQFGRVASDQGQVALLKDQSYAAAVDDLVKRYVR